MELQLELKDSETILRLKEYADNMLTNLAIGMKRAVQYVRSQIDKNITSGKFGIKTDNGGLRNSLATDVLIEDKTIVGKVGSNLAYARIHEVGGMTKPKVTPLMKKWAWAMWYKTDDLFYKNLALTKKGELNIKIKAKWYMRNTLIQNKQNVLRILEESIKPK